MKRPLSKITLFLFTAILLACNDNNSQNLKDATDLSYNENEIAEVDKRTDSIKLTSDPENSCINNDIYWYKNGTLSRSDGNDWKKSEELNRLSTCGGFLFELSNQKGIKPKVLSDDFILSSKSLMQCIDEYYSISENKNTSFKKAAMLCLLS